MEDCDMSSEMTFLSKVVAVMLLAAALSGSAYAGCSSGGCGVGSGGEWRSGLDFIGASPDAVSVVNKAPEAEAIEVEEAMAPPSEITPEKLAEDREGDQRLVTAYVGVPGETSYIEGSIHLPLDQVFNEDGTLKSPAEIADLFGAAGISEDDPIVIYGDYLMYETFAFWVMKYIGHEEVFILEGTRGDREAAGLLFVANPKLRTAEVYVQDPNPDLLAGDEDLVEAQLVDASSVAEYDAWHAEGAINIESSEVVGPDGRLADDEALSSAFSGLDMDQPVVVTSSRRGQAPIVWYALYTQGRQASLYLPASQA
jgi:thiosulfate/3-mercaptopyruvate sulfurtransferase